MHTHKPDTRPVSEKNGYLLMIYLFMQNLIETKTAEIRELKSWCKLMDQKKPWYD